MKVESAAMGEPTLDAVQLVKTFDGRRALDGFSLQASAGEIVGLLGPNGAGKTTFVSIVSALLRPDAGQVRVGGVDVAVEPRRARQMLGMAPQETGVYPTLTCRQNLRFFAELSGLRRGRRGEAVDRVAASLGLSRLLDRRAGALSGGERRRLHSAIALVHRPPLVLLDEPTTGSDVETRAQLLDLVGEVAADGCAVVYSTHYLPEIEQLDASVVIIDHGRQLAKGSVADLVAAHGAAEVTIRFHSRPPRLLAPGEATIEVDGTTVRIRARDPGAAAAHVLKQLGSEVAAVRSFDIVQPSLETAFRQLTGSNASPADEVAHVG
jgi:ABC-2 type transport system ATP-binding protein